MGRRLASAAATIMFLFALPITGASPAHASCSSESGPSGAPIIFVGTADAERGGFTRFTVTEVWAGPDLAPEVWVLSGQEQPRWPLNLFLGVGSSDDAEFVHGDRYVVGASKAFHTGACAVDEVPAGRRGAAGRPENFRMPTADGAEGANPPIGPLAQGLWVAGLATVLGTAAALFGAHRADAQKSATRPTTSSTGPKTSR